MRACNPQVSPFTRTLQTADPLMRSLSAKVPHLTSPLAASAPHLCLPRRLPSGSVSWHASHAELEFLFQTLVVWRMYFSKALMHHTHHVLNTAYFTAYPVPLSDSNACANTCSIVGAGFQGSRAACDYGSGRAHAPRGPEDFRVRRVYSTTRDETAHKKLT